MDMKTFVADLLDLRPIPVATRYAAGTGLQGSALGLLVAHWFTSGLPPLLWLACGSSFAVGVVLAVSAYSQLKRQHGMQHQADSDPDT